MATGLAGFVGTLGVFALGLGLAFAVAASGAAAPRPPELVGGLCNHSLDLTGLGR